MRRGRPDRFAHRSRYLVGQIPCREGGRLAQPSVRSRTIAERRARTAALRDLAELPQSLPRVRTSERGTFKRCHWKWWLEFVEFRKPITDIPALRYGSLFHLALGTYYPPGLKRGPHPVQTFLRAYDQELADLKTEFGQRVRDEAAGDERWVDARELGEAMLQNYIDEYRTDGRYKVLVTEQRFDTLVFHPVTGEPWFVYCGVMDGIWLDTETNRIMIVDHKTAKAISTKYLSLDDQATAYWTYGLDWVYKAGIIGPDVRPAGMLFNICRKAIPDNRPQNAQGQYLNKDGSVSKVQPSPYFLRQPIYRDWAEREQARQRVLIEFADMERIRLAGVEEAYKNPGQFTCPGCWAFDVCELDEVGAPGAAEVKEQTTRPWLPYHQREVYAGR